ncbi:hypothetical protein Enr10x_12180 [Gimesia panareensis]|uniref:Uncharacterized protein n=1 Tax=Gimesia panareensis TaxID=2527978 RepID=A0A517Q2S4_9PLAN|nr:hypothetical protein [Gimesia panareensis]QDT25920.1 hypothetical protein Enr10x_12180 [Gimesia panareensis]
MNLVEYQSKLEIMIESRHFDQRAQLEKLATSSPAHQRLWEDFLILEQTLPAWKQSLPETDLVDAVLAQLDSPSGNSGQPTTRSEQPPGSTASSQRFSAPWIWASSLVAAALLFAVTIPFFSNRTDVDSGTTVATSTTIAPVPRIDEHQPPVPQDIDQLLKNAGAASWGLAQSTAGAMSEAVTLVPVTRPESRSSEPDPTEPNWVDDINTEMQPFKDQINHAWNFIIHSVPESSTKI